MGQYYKAIILASANKRSANKTKVMASITSWDFNNGAKLMEHSYIGNYFVGAFESLINKESGEYAGLPVAWGGDYADNEPNPHNHEKVNLYDLAHAYGKKIKFGDIEPKHYRYIINEDDKEYIDTLNPNCACNTPWEGLTINMLPLLIAEGNGRGGGDYHGKNERYVGIWARHIVVVSDNKPDNTYKEVEMSFEEE